MREERPGKVRCTDDNGSRTTIKEIARLSGLSRATVSAVINGKPGISEKSRNRILTAIRENRLHHRLMARSLMGHFSQMYAVVVPDINNPFYTDVLNGFLSELRGQENHMICHPTDGSHEDEVRTVEALLAYDLGGYVLAAAQKGESTAHIRRILESGKPLVTIGAVPGLETHTVDFENRKGSKTATDYLIERGHRRIVCLAGLTTSQSSKERVLGFVESLLDHGFAFDDSMVVWTDADSEGGYRKALETLSQVKPRPTALLCFNDVVAIGAYRAAYELGLHIPRDISIVGFDDIELASVMGPPLTTVAIFAFETGRTAARILSAVLRGEHKGGFIHKMIQTRLIERGSVRNLNGAKYPSPPNV